MRTSLSLLLIALLAACNAPAPPAPSTTIAAAKTETLEVRQERGRYLVGIMGCNDCHSPKLMGAQGPYNDPARLLSGHPADQALPNVPTAALKDWVLFPHTNTAAVGPWGVSYAGNITSDASGIGNWSEEQFARAMRQGKWKGLEGARQLLPPMPWPNYAKMPDADISAIYAYLMTTTPVENVVPAPVSPDQL